ncbi:uncharacterized protein LOC118433072 [Folsomia candida]|nr:uncharacterized protein LOC118433072 [Folsomia candida]
MSTNNNGVLLVRKDDDGDTDNLGGLSNRDDQQVRVGFEVGFKKAKISNNFQREQLGRPGQAAAAAALVSSGEEFYIDDDNFGGGGGGGDYVDPRKLKNIMDDIAERILAAADALYASMNPPQAQPQRTRYSSGSEFSDDYSSNRGQKWGGVLSSTCLSVLLFVIQLA